MLFCDRSGAGTNKVMANINLGWSVRIGLVVCIVALLALNWLARRDPSGMGPSTGPVGATGTGNATTGPLLVNDDWQIRNMATAQGAFVIEVEAEDPSQVEAIARALIEPIKADYDEILVYVSRVDDPSDLPARRMQWTPQDGYVEIAYGQSQSAR